MIWTNIGQYENFWPQQTTHEKLESMDVNEERVHVVDLHFPLVFVLPIRPMFHYIMKYLDGKNKKRFSEM